MSNLKTEFQNNISKQLVGTNQVGIDGTHLVWVGTNTFTPVVFFGREVSGAIATENSGGSCAVITSTNFGPFSTLVGFGLSVWSQAFLENREMTYATTMFAASGSSTSTFCAKWTLGLGSLDSLYPVFNWNVLGVRLAREFQNSIADNGSTRRFAGWYGAVVFNSFGSVSLVNGDGDGPNKILATRVVAVTTGTLATVIFRGTAHQDINAYKIVLFGSMAGTSEGGFVNNPSYDNPCATFQKYVSDPGDWSGGTWATFFGQRGAGWITVGSGEVWAGTFYLET